MQTGKRVLDDLARVASGAAGAAGAVRDEMESMVRDRMQSLLDSMDLVRREDFEAVQEMAQNARMEQERLEARVAALEARLAETGK
ncbi:MAG: accessory factor UbiK family protein [Alphaproteobacteria bacterium]|nr:accessory factor UbiK family protein [Alphaproteobacteria bacterium]